MNRPILDDGHVRMPEEDFESLLEISAERGARRALATVGLVDEQAASDVREMRNLLDALRMAKRTAWQTLVRMATTGLLLALIAGVALKLKIFGGTQ